MEVNDEYIDLFWSGFKDVHTDYEGCNFEDLIWGLKTIGNSNHFNLSYQEMLKMEEEQNEEPRIKAERERLKPLYVMIKCLTMHLLLEHRD